MEGGFSFHRSPHERVGDVVPTKERAAFFERAHLLQAFRVTDPEPALREVTVQREHALQPERSLWDAVELMIRDEILRDRLLKFQGTDNPSAPEKREALYQDYRKIIAGYQALIELADASQDRTWITREIIPHTNLGQLRVRLADLLANIPAYFPEQKHTPEDKRQAFQRLREAFYASAQEGVQAEIALVGLLRYGPEWLQGKERGEKHLSPTLFVERTMPREDVLRSTPSGGRRAGQFNGADLIYKVPGEERIRSVQLKTGKLEDKPWHVHLPALELIVAYEQVAGSSSMQGSAKPDLPGVRERSIYYNALEQTIEALRFDEATRHLMKQRLMPSVPAPSRRSERPPPPGQGVSWRALKHMLETSQDFRRFAQAHGMPLVADQKDLLHWSQFLKQARATHAQETFWRAWPKPSTSLPN